MRLIHDDAVYSHLDVPVSPPALQVVMTRFDMTIQSAPVQDEAASKAYLKSRIPIFRAICLASMRAQTTRPDRWIIGFGPRRRAEIEPLLAELASEDWIQPVWQQESDGVTEPGDQTFLRAIGSLVRPEHRYVLSSRLDNDDAVSLGFCEAVRTYAAAALAKEPHIEDFWISFPFGVQFDGKRCRLFTRNNNAFLSRCERAEGFAAGTAGAAIRETICVFSSAGGFTCPSRTVRCGCRPSMGRTFAAPRRSTFRRSARARPCCVGSASNRRNSRRLGSTPDRRSRESRGAEMSAALSSAPPAAPRRDRSG